MGQFDPSERGPLPFEIEAKAKADANATDTSLGIVRKATKTVADLWGDVIVRTTKIAMKIPKGVLSLPQTLAVFLLACLVVCVFVAVVYVAIYLLMHTHPRLPLPSHSSAMDGFMSKLTADLVHAMTEFHDGCSGGRRKCFLLGGMSARDYCVARNDTMEATTDCEQGGAQDGLNDLQGTANALQNAVGQLLERWTGRSSDDELLLYYGFHKEIAKMNCFARHDIKANAPDLCSDGDIDTDVIEDFVKGVVRPMSVIERVSEELSQKLDGLPGLSNLPTWDVASYKIGASVHTMRLLTGYKGAAHFMLKTRRKKMYFAIWTQYYWPYVEDIYEHRIPEIWLKTGPRYVQYIKSGVNWWWGVGIKLGQLPCNMAFPDPVERLEKCNRLTAEGFASSDGPAAPVMPAADENPDGGFIRWFDSKETKKRRWIARRDQQRAERIKERADRERAATKEAENTDTREGYEDHDIKEGVSIMGALSAIVDFIRNIEYVGIAIYRFGQKFPGDPFGSIIGILSLIVGTILGLLLVLIYMLMTFTGMFWLPLCVWGIILVFVSAILYTLFQFILSVLMAIPYLVLWLIDLPTRGLVTRMLRCENLPDDWAALPNFAEENVYRRMAFLCFKPCGARYTPAGCLCRKRKFYMPDYCPQQQIYRVFAGKGIKGGVSRYDGPYVFDTYHPLPGFGRKSLQSKQKTILSAYRDKMKWYQKCYVSMEDYGFVNRHVCRNVKLVPGLSDDQVDRLSVLCREAYCDYRPTSGLIGGTKSGIKATMTGEEEAKSGVMCGALYGKKRPGADAAKSADSSAMGGPGTALLRRVLLMIMLVLAALAMFYSMLQAAKHMAASINK
jgi:hypothetical protein